VPSRAIFRESAAEAYRRRREKDILPRLVSTPIVLCSWSLLAALIVAVVIACFVRVPTYVSASGAILGNADHHHPAGEPMVAVLFIPTDQSAETHVGQSVHLRVGSSFTYVQGVVTEVASTPIGPQAARSRYGCCVPPDLIEVPSIAVIAGLGTALPSDLYGGLRVTARVETGSRRLGELMLQAGVRR
jgi:hypothetical protein